MTNAPRSKERGVGMSKRVRNKDKYDIPMWHRPTISIAEASAYSGIGTGKLYEMTDTEDCPFVLWVGTRRVIKRKPFVEYLESEGFTCIDNDSYNRHDIIDSGLPIIADMHDRTIFRSGNVTCAAGAAQSKMIISDKEFYMLYASRKA